MLVPINKFRIVNVRMRDPSAQSLDGQEESLHLIEPSRVEIKEAQIKIKWILNNLQQHILKSSENELENQNRLIFEPKSQTDVGSEMEGSKTPKC